MLAKVVESKFPPGVQIPESIRALCDFVDANGYPLSGCFEISTLGDEDLQAWFPNDPVMRETFAVFGRGSTGSVYAVWLQDGLDIDSSPIIVLGSEGELHVLASDPTQFCRLLGCGYNELEWDDLNQPSPDWEAAEPLRSWLAERLNIAFPTSGDEIVSVANQQLPKLTELIHSYWDANSD